MYEFVKNPNWSQLGPLPAGLPQTPINFNQTMGQNLFPALTARLAQGNNLSTIAYRGLGGMGKLPFDTGNPAPYMWDLSARGASPLLRFM